jgi:cholesterol oxidase
MKNHYGVVVIGSGYGGGIAASRMARAGQTVCLLERGKELQPGEYPDTEVEALAEIQVNTPEANLGAKTGLYRFHANQDIDVLVGCGLGGTSLINANVSIRPEERVFQDDRWPRELRGHPEVLGDGYRHAEEMLKPTPYPTTSPVLAKMVAQQTSAAGMGATFNVLNINVTFQDGTNHVGVHQNACTLCGDCVTGCNFGAKNTTLMNYLPDAHNHGAEIYTEANVRFIERKDGRWLVHFEWLTEGREAFPEADMFVTADIVVLAAGTLGSTEILLRSKAAGLPVSNALGQRFTGNGDVLGFSYNADEAIHGVGCGNAHPGDHAPVGPCITSVIDLRNQPNLNDGMVIEEGSIPGALAHFLPGALSATAADIGQSQPVGLVKQLQRREREAESLVAGSYRGAVDHTQVYLVMTHDDSNGRMTLEGDRVRVKWPGVGTQPIFQRVNERLKQASDALGGIYVHNPVWTKWLRNNLVTVHPLGGAVMADSAESGVVNHKGQVFSGTAGTGVHDGLYVADGAVIPLALGVNPLLTISAVAERTCALIAQDRGWTIDYTLPSVPKAVPAAAVGVEFTETMKGFMSLAETADYQKGFDAGEQQGSNLEFTLTIASSDVRRIINDANHEADMAGTVSAPKLSSQPMTISSGKFNLFTVDPTQPDTFNMKYRMTLNSVEGRALYFEGFKVVRKNRSTTLWDDTSTLYITIYDGADNMTPVMGKGILHIQPEDFAKQLTTMRAINAANEVEGTRVVLDFGRFFAGSLWEIYGPQVLRALTAKAPV